MARLKNDPITADDLAQFANSNSDFGFEMRVLSHLTAAGFFCEHAGTYQDPISDKIRQFDIRALINHCDSALSLAVECKNVRSWSPLLLSAVPRSDSEAFHDLVVCRDLPYRHLEVLPVTGASSAYRSGEMTAKKTDQVGRDQSGLLTSNDEATFDKLNQAVSSCHGLLHSFCQTASPQHRRVIAPLLVVPDETLWQVDYHQDGSIAVLPRQVPRAALYLDHSWTVPFLYGGTLTYRLSHIELVTLGALTQAVDEWLGPAGFFPS